MKNPIIDPARLGPPPPQRTIVPGMVLAVTDGRFWYEATVVAVRHDRQGGYLPRALVDVGIHGRKWKALRDCCAIVR